MEIYRLFREKYGNPLSGKGAAIKGGRWNSKGFELVYTAANRCLSMAEVAVHFSLGTMPDGYSMAVLYLPEDISMQIVNREALPPFWNHFPHVKSTQVIGDRFITENKFCVLKVPSVVVQNEYNLLLNPAHREFQRIKVIHTAPFKFDKRLF